MNEKAKRVVNAFLNNSAKEAFLDRRDPIHNATKAARRVLEDISRKFKVNYNSLLSALSVKK